MTDTAENGLPDPAAMMARLFPKRRVRLVIEADLDPIPGWGHEPHDWQLMLQGHLDDAVSHYNPTVELEETPMTEAHGADIDAPALETLVRALADEWAVEGDEMSHWFAAQLLYNLLDQVRAPAAPEETP